MINERKYFNEAVNADDDFELLKAGQWINASNIRAFTSDTGAFGRIEAVGGTMLLFDNLPAGTNRCIGGCSDDAGNRMFFFNLNSNGEHGIYCYDYLLLTPYTVLLSSQVTGGLNFSAYIHSSIYVDNKIYWTDNVNEPRRINVEAGIKLNYALYSTDVIPYSLPIAQQVITIIRAAPALPPVISKLTDAAYENNFIANTVTQFSTRYLFRDYEYSVIGAWSTLAAYNDTTQHENYVNILLPRVGAIEQDVLEVELLVRHGNTGNPFVIHSYTRAEIVASNLLGTPLSFNFYNDIAGTAVDLVAAAKPFDSVPLLAEAIEFARNRLFLANIKEGYNSPTTTSLLSQVISVPGGISSTSGIWGKIKFKYFTGDVLHSHYYFYSATTVPSYYYFDTLVPPAIPTDPIDLTTATFSGDTVRSVFEYLYAIYHTGPFDNSNYDLVPTTYTSLISGSTAIELAGRRVFKSDSTYYPAVWFFDKYRRKCGVIKSDINKLKTPERTYSQASYNIGINWFLSNFNAAAEIPEWAHYYAVGRTKAITKSMFIQGRSHLVDYVVKNPDDTYTHHLTFSNDHFGVAIDISSIVGYGMGYIFQEGDAVDLYFLTGPVGKQELTVIGQDGVFIICTLKDMGTLGLFGVAQESIFEIYTPYKEALNELFYEVGNIFAITNPETPARAYSMLEGTLNGDVYVKKRENAYYTENMSPNDRYWKQWETDIGWPNIVDKIGQVTLPDPIIFSDVYLQGTKVNGLSSFQVLNRVTLDGKGGAIMKLQLADKVQQDGSVMLALAENETTSCYLGESELLDTQGSAFVAKGTNVIGTTKTLKGSYGTRHPESVFEYNGLVFFYDERNGAFVRYSANGLFAVSNNKMVRATALMSRNLAKITPRPLVIGGVDPYHKEVLFSVPQSTTIPPKGYLTDFPQIIYPYDIYDGTAKTLMYKNEADVWIGSMSFYAEKFIRLGSNIFSFNGGRLFIHNKAQPAYFYNQQFTAKLMYAVNPGQLHTFISIGLECSKKPAFVHLRLEDPNVQSSDLVKADFVNKEGVQYSKFLRDRLSPNTTGTYIEKLIKGDRLTGKALLVMLEYQFATPNVWDSSFDDTFNGNAGDNSKLALRFCDVSHIINTGHLMSK